MIRAALLCLVLATPAAAQDALATQSAAAAARLAEAEALLAEAPHTDNQVVTLAAAIRTYEDGLIAVRAGVAETTGQYETIRAALTRDRAKITQMLGAVQAADRPSTTLSFHPAGARAAAQAQLIRASLGPSLDRDIAALRAQLAQLAKVTALKDKAATTLAEGQVGHAAVLTALQQALTDHLPAARFVEDPAVIAKLQAAAPTRDLLIPGLAALYTGGLPSDESLASRGALPLPATGRHLNTDATPGLILATPPQALVVAPTSATILYLGPVPGFEQAVVLEPTPGTTFVFAGLSQTFGAAGQLIPAGWPLGLMAETMGDTDANLTTKSTIETGNAAQALYLEVRDGQSPVDPATWFALQQQMDVQ